MQTPSRSQQKPFETSVVPTALGIFVQRFPALKRRAITVAHSVGLNPGILLVLPGARYAGSHLASALCSVSNHTNDS